METLKKQELPIFVVLLCGVIVTLAYFLNIPFLQALSEDMQTWAVIIAGFSLGIGIVNISRIHGKHIQHRTDGQWIFSIIFFAFFIVQAVTGFADFQNLQKAWLRREQTT